MSYLSLTWIAFPIGVTYGDSVTKRDTSVYFLGARILPFPPLRRNRILLYFLKRKEKKRKEKKKKEKKRKEKKRISVNYIF